MKTCPVCNALDHTILFTAQNRHGRHLWNARESFRIQQCLRCGLVFLGNVQVNESYYYGYYPPGYYEEGKVHGPLAWLLDLMGRASVRAKQKGILRFIAREGDKKLGLLDVGCGSGYFLEKLDGRVFSKNGLEVNEEGVASCRKKNLHVVQSGIHSAGFENESFDVVTMWHVLEHLESPARCLREVSRILETGGVLALCTPNTQSLAARHGRELWFHLDAPRHLALFNRKNLCELLEREGFEVKAARRLPWEFPLDLFWSLRRSWLKFLVYPLYPLVKFFDDENIFVLAVKK
jgi:SAM-dependent methyltransferase